MFAGLGKFTQLIRELETNGMSDDEKDTRDLLRVPPKYLIRKLEWRSAELTQFLRNLDLLHLSTRFTEKGDPTPGNWPRYRVEGRLIDDHSPVIKGLPLNFYDSEWLLSLEPEHREQIGYRPPVELKMGKTLLS